MSWRVVFRIGGRLGSHAARRDGADLEIPPTARCGTNPVGKRETVLAGQFTWGGCLLKGNGGVQR